MIGYNKIDKDEENEGKQRRVMSKSCNLNIVLV